MFYLKILIHISEGFFLQPAALLLTQDIYFIWRFLYFESGYSFVTAKSNGIEFRIENQIKGTQNFDRHKTMADTVSFLAINEINQPKVEIVEYFTSPLAFTVRAPLKVTFCFAEF